LQIALALRQPAKVLDGSLDVLLLIQKSLAQLGGPGEIVVEPLENGGIMGQGLDAGIPGLLGDLAQIAAVVDITVRQDNLRGHGGGGEYLGQQGVRIERNGLEQLIERVG
jgi:hypothetical protein